jgi:large subunit ribosomal protein L22
MEFSAKARYIKISPYKLRPMVDVIRGKNAEFALGWLRTNEMQKTLPIRKLIESAVANVQQKTQSDVPASDLIVKEIRVDHGPAHKYFKPSAQGRAMVQRKRLSHISVVLTKKEA